MLFKQMPNRAKRLRQSKARKQHHLHNLKIKIMPPAQQNGKLHLHKMRLHLVRIHRMLVHRQTTQLAKQAHPIMAAMRDLTIEDDELVIDTESIADGDGLTACAQWQISDDGSNLENIARRYTIELLPHVIQRLANSYACRFHMWISRETQKCC